MGARFRTKSDTEVLLEAWRYWGPEALQKLRGMFAFALLNESTGELVIARDHFGIKPLHYALREHGIVFGSELKALLPALDIPVLDQQGLVASLAFGWMPDAYCIWKDVRKLPAGHWATFSPSGTLDVRCYYDIRKEVQEASALATTDDDLSRILEDSISAHMVADVPVSTFLSGGLDSSLITVLAKRMAGHLDSYTIAFRSEDMKLEAMPDDLRYARQVSQQFGIHLHEIEIAPDIAAMLPKLVDTLDEPIGDAAAINTFLICTMARQEGVKVLLSGMGADEMFGGYRKHQAAIMSARYRRLPQVLRKGLIEPIIGAMPVAMLGRGLRPVRFAKRFLSFSNLAPEASFRRSYSYFDETEATSILRGDLLPLAKNAFDLHADIYREAPGDDLVNRMCYTDVRLFMEALNLTYTDRASMAASTEVRVPFIDKHVMAAAFSIGGSRKIIGSNRKAVLKNVAKNVLPKEIVNRPKALFSAPLRAWIRRDLCQQVDDLVLNGQLVNSGWLRGAWVKKIVEADRAGTADYAREIWQLLTTENWLNHNNVTLN
jgi:asparagine synthase (glutamine-hydrolysing)